MDLGKTIREIRKSKKISQKKLANDVGISVTALFNIETKNTQPKKETFDKISESLGVSKEYILFRAITIDDVSDEKRSVFKVLQPILLELLDTLN